MIKLEAATLTDPGRERQANEDNVWAQVYAPSQGEPVGLFIVCDGIGGHLGGECASHWAVETIKRELAHLFCPPDPRATVLLSQAEVVALRPEDIATRFSVTRKIEGEVIRAVEKANQVVFDYAQKKPQKAAEAGTTISMAIALGNRVVIANVGDSRTYLLRDRQLRQISQDHSLVATLVAAGQITPEEVYVHPQRNLIYRSLGYKREVEVDTFWEIIKPGDYLLLCSDGLWEMVQDEQLIVRLITDAGTTRRACEKLVEAANTAGGEDNIGVVVVGVT
ncbi:MAG: serine/threonine-protein phosphatase [Anaerolineales bacterium]|nr:serine/threonine-protein phosphatase [Anaerolineales bacterium]